MLLRYETINHMDSVIAIAICVGNNYSSVKHILIETFVFNNYTKHWRKLIQKYRQFFHSKENMRACYFLTASSSWVFFNGRTKKTKINLEFNMLCQIFLKIYFRWETGFNKRLFEIWWGFLLASSIGNIFNEFRRESHLTP